MANRQPTVEELNNVKQSTVQWEESAHRVFSVNNIVDSSYDSILVTYPDASSEVYTFSSDGTSVAVVTVTYTDATKCDLYTVVRS